VILFGNIGLELRRVELIYEDFIVSSAKQQAKNGKMVQNRPVFDEFASREG